MSSTLLANANLDPSPRLRPLNEIAARLDQPPGVTGDFKNGFRHALRWVLGESDKSPGSRTLWKTGPPSPELVDAEYQLVVGHVYTEGLKAVLNQQFNGGGESALRWALGGNDPDHRRGPAAGAQAPAP